jgi:putative endonuclease
VSQPNRPDSRQTGQDAERYAAELLRQRGLTILATNVRYRFGEIDLVAREGESLVFVEVRARRPGPMGQAIETLTYRKRTRVVRAVERYLQEHNVDQRRPVRIDVVAIDLDSSGRPVRAEVVPNAFG